MLIPGRIFARRQQLLQRTQCGGHQAVQVALPRDQCLRRAKWSMQDKNSSGSSTAYLAMQQASTRQACAPCDTAPHPAAALHSHTAWVAAPRMASRRLPATAARGPAEQESSRARVRQAATQGGSRQRRRCAGRGARASAGCHSMHTACILVPDPSRVPKARGPSPPQTSTLPRQLRPLSPSLMKLPASAEHA